MLRKIIFLILQNTHKLARIISSHIDNGNGEFYSFLPNMTGCLLQFSHYPKIALKVPRRESRTFEGLKTLIKIYINKF